MAMKRRSFLKSSATAGSFFILPSGLWANSPNGKVCTAHIAVGGKGKGDLGQIASHPKVQVLGLCDVDKVRSNPDKLLTNTPAPSSSRTTAPCSTSWVTRSTRFRSPPRTTPTIPPPWRP